MGIFIIIGLVVITLLTGLTYLIYLVPKKLGYPKVGKYLAILVGLFFVWLTIITIFEDQLFSKKDARELLIEQDINLADKFEILENESMSAIGDYYHTFTLDISEKDRQIIINQIKNSPDFKGFRDKKEDLFRSADDRYEGNKLTKNYESDRLYVREYYQPNGQGYAPTYRKIEVDKKQSRLTFEEINE
ncbi:hypothetical protein [Chryseobacterium sp. Leaf180]|uniref:hypothetical protein n=1 Tax=Chryseobacterium sp. Leaf180 TaxID=1736289 RepID=UPI000A91A688|nr:hypothetical protein [Chryseobacterium sp. Leaf180]